MVLKLMKWIFLVVWISLPFCVYLQTGHAKHSASAFSPPYWASPVGGSLRCRHFVLHAAKKKCLQKERNLVRFGQGQNNSSSVRSYVHLHCQKRRKDQATEQMQALFDQFRQREGQCWAGHNNGIRATSFGTRIMAWKKLWWASTRSMYLNAKWDDEVWSMKITS